mmetsp:Transcript_35393/g.69870  ORF Transcript_35393/g.69870 Transcript_35393/m.69870 type:complete len:207 (+) Transcript_35393:857-1477(+)
MIHPFPSQLTSLSLCLHSVSVLWGWPCSLGRICRIVPGVKRLWLSILSVVTTLRDRLGLSQPPVHDQQRRPCLSSLHLLLRCVGLHFEHLGLIILFFIVVASAVAPPAQPALLLSLLALLRVEPTGPEPVDKKRYRTQHQKSPQGHEDPGPHGQAPRILFCRGCVALALNGYCTLYSIHVFCPRSAGRGVFLCGNVCFGALSVGCF